MKIRENFVEPITVFGIKNDMGELLDHINTEIKKIKSDFIATFISNNSIRIYLFKKSLISNSMFESPSTIFGYSPFHFSLNASIAFSLTILSVKESFIF